MKHIHSIDDVAIATKSQHQAYRALKMKQLTLPQLKPTSEERQRFSKSARNRRTAAGWFRLMHALVDRAPDLREKFKSRVTTKPK